MNEIFSPLAYYKDLGIFLSISNTELDYWRIPFSFCLNLKISWFTSNNVEIINSGSLRIEIFSHLQLDNGNVADIMQTAHYFRKNNEKIVNVCTEYIMKSKEFLDQSNCLRLFVFADLYNLKELVEMITVHLSSNFKEIWNGEDFKDIYWQH